MITFLPALFSFIEKCLAIIYNSSMSYKVVETSTVTDEEIEKILNEWTARGYSFSSIHFVTNESSRRPKTAFIFFTQAEERFGFA